MKYAAVVLLGLIVSSACSEASDPRQTGMTAEQIRTKVALDDPADQIGLALTDDALLVRAATVYGQKLEREGRAGAKYVGSEVRRTYTCLYNANQPVTAEWWQNVCGDIIISK